MYRIIFFFAFLQSLLPYYSVKPEPFLRDFLHLFRQKYGITANEVVVINSWSDSSHVYFDGRVVDGNVKVTARRQTVTLNKEETSLYSTRKKTLVRDIGLDLDYDDQCCFRICFHRNNTICNILSYEGSQSEGIPILLSLENLYGIKTMEDDPDEPDMESLDPFFIDNPARTERDEREITREITVGLKKLGVWTEYPSKWFAVIDIDKTGQLRSIGIIKPWDISEIDKRITDYIQAFFRDEIFIPGSHRGHNVDSKVTVPFMVLPQS